MGSSGEFEMVLIKREDESNVFDEVFDISKVKYEPCEIGIFGESGHYYNGSSSERSFRDHKNTSLKCEHQKDEKYGAIELKPEDVDFTTLSTNECKENQIKREDDIDIYDNEVKTEVIEEHLGECGLGEKCNNYVVSQTDFPQDQNVYNFNGIQDGNVTQEDMKPSFYCCTTDSRLQLRVHEETFSGNKRIYEPNLSATNRRNAVPSNTDNIVENNILLNHQSVDISEEQYNCKFCARLFRHWCRLKAHERNHTRDKSYRCEVCSKAFTSLGNLEIHGRIHTGERPFRCESCTKTFTSVSNLNKHMRVHTEEKPFQCEICFRSFSSSSNLKVHYRVHTGEKPYQCSFCENSFGYLQSLQNHEKIHTGGNPFFCHICSKAFNNSNSLMVHERFHTEH